MKKNNLPVYVLLNAPKGAFVNIKRGLKIFLFSVGVGLSTPVYALSDVDNPIRTETVMSGIDTEISLHANDISDSKVSSFARAEKLEMSLYEHRGELMSNFEMDGFWNVANQLATINFTDSMVCFEQDDKEVTYDLLDESGLVLHLTQYFKQPIDQIVYSIENNGQFLAAGHAPINDFTPQLKTAIQEAIKAL